jgi:polysaccharide export outer membrane protein
MPAGHDQCRLSLAANDKSEADMARALLAFASAVLAMLWANAAVAQAGNYQIQPGDTLAIEVLEDSNLNRNVLVTPDGRFSFPLAGSIAAGGRTISQVERALTSALSPNFTNPPNVFVSVANVAPPTPGDAAEAEDTVTVYLVGEVNAPGPKAVMPGSTILLRRTDPQTGASRLFVIDYRAISRGARIVRQPIMREGDVLLVPERRLFE